MAQLPQPETAEAIDRFGFPELQDELNHAIQYFQSMDQRLQARIGTYTVYGQVVDGSELVLNDILKWVKDQVLRDLCSKHMNSKADGMRVAEAGLVCGESYLIEKCVDCISADQTDQRLTAHRLIPALQLHIKKAKDHHWTYSAMLGFLSEVGTTFARETVQDVFRVVLKDFIPCITLAARDKKRIRIGSSDYVPPAHLNPDDIIQLLQQCIILDLGLEVHGLFDKLQNLAATEEPAAVVMKTFFIPFTGKLYKMAAERSTTPVAPETQDRVSTFTAEIFDLYANRCVGPKPMPPVDWRRAECGCGCEKCLLLDSFLANPSQEESSISAGNEEGVKHLTSQLPRIDPGG
ncbi:hypothetical protein LTR11_011518 [Exophiala xenobiotica]|nr:hypothetical protein LTR11_011518 [Exophiala xenobiotica]